MVLPKRRCTILLSLLVTLMAGLISACATPAPKTALTGATVTQSNHFSSADTGTTHTKHVALTVTPPAVPPAPGSSTQPSAVNIDGKSVLALAGTTVSYVADEETHETPAITTEENVANATGVSIQTNGDKGDIDGKPPTVAINPVNITGPNGTGAKGGGGKSSGGETDFGWTELVAQVSAASSTAKWMMWLGTIFLIVGWGGCAVYSWISDKIQWVSIAIVTGIGTAIIGTAIILDTHPIFFIIAVLAGGGVLVWHFYHKVSTAPPSTGTGATPAPSTLASFETAVENEYQELIGHLKPPAPATATVSSKNTIPLNA